MPEIALPTFNGIAPSWADIGTTFDVDGGAILDTSDYSSINWGSSVEIGNQRGAGGRIKKSTTGQPDYECTITFYASGFRSLVKSLVPLAPVRGRQRLISLVHFTILIQRTPPGETDIFVTKIKGCRLMSNAVSLAEGSDADLVEVAVHTKEIVDIIDGQEVLLV